MKQIGLAVIQYIQDYDERFPMSLYETTQNNQRCLFTVYHAGCGKIEGDAQNRV